MSHLYKVEIHSEIFILFYNYLINLLNWNYTLQQNANHANVSDFSSSNLQIAIPSFIDGIVSNANKSTPEFNSISNLGLCHSTNSYLKQ